MCFCNTYVCVIMYVLFQEKTNFRKNYSVSYLWVILAKQKNIGKNHCEPYVCCVLSNTVQYGGVVMATPNPYEHSNV
jgi:hypothetical protein